MLGDKVFHFLTGKLSVAQIQWFMGDTYHVFKNWTKQNGMSALSDDLGENTRLLWIGRPRTDKVILYFHGEHDIPPLVSVVDAYPDECT